MQTLSSGWTGPFIVTEKVSVVDYRIKMNPTGPSNVVHVDQLILHPCHQDRSNWVRDELARRIEEQVIDVGTDLIESRMKTVGVNIGCQTSDTDPIVVANDNIAPTSTVRRSSRDSFFLLSTDLGLAKPSEVDDRRDVSFRNLLSLEKEILDWKTFIECTISTFSHVEII